MKNNKSTERKARSIAIRYPAIDVTLRKGSIVELRLKACTREPFSFVSSVCARSLPLILVCIAISSRLTWRPPRRSKTSTVISDRSERIFRSFDVEVNHRAWRTTSFAINLSTTIETRGNVYGCRAHTVHARSTARRSPKDHHAWHISEPDASCRFICSSTSHKQRADESCKRWIVASMLWIS